MRLAERWVNDTWRRDRYGITIKLTHPHSVFHLILGKSKLQKSASHGQHSQTVKPTNGKSLSALWNLRTSDCWRFLCKVGGQEEDYANKKHPEIEQTQALPNLASCLTAACSGENFSVSQVNLPTSSLTSYIRNWLWRRRIGASQ